MLQFGDIVSATHDGMRGEWRFDIMLDMKTFYSVPNWLKVEGRRLPVIVSGRKPACWHCGEIGHLSAVCPGKKAPKKPDHKPGTLSPVVKINTEKEAPVVSPTPAGKKNPTPPSSPTVNSDEAKAEWLTVGKGGRKLQPEDPRSQKSSQVGTDSSTPPQKRPIPTSYPHMPKNHPPQKIKAHSRPHPNNTLLPRSDASAQAGRSLKNYWSLKRGWTRSENRLRDQDPLIPPLHHRDNLESSDRHQPHHLIDPCLHLSCRF